MLEGQIVRGMPTRKSHAFCAETENLNVTEECNVHKDTVRRIGFNGPLALDKVPL